MRHTGTLGARNSCSCTVTDICVPNSHLNQNPDQGSRGFPPRQSTIANGYLTCLVLILTAVGVVALSAAEVSNVVGSVEINSQTNDLEDFFVSAVWEAK